MKKKIAFALILAIFTAAIVTFVNLALNVGFVSGFLKLWMKAFFISYLVIVPSILLIGPRIQHFVQVTIRED